MSTYYKKGDWNAICAVCGGKFKASELRWNSQLQDWTCKDDTESRHPQERIKAKKDIQAVPWVRAEPGDVFLTSHYAAPDNSNPVNPNYVEFGYWI